MRARLTFVMLIALARAARADTLPAIALPPDTLHWELEGRAEPAEHQGRHVLHLNGGAALVKGLELRDGIIDMDLAVTGAPLQRGFVGLQFRVSDDLTNGEYVYLRPHKSGLPDAIQYTPVLHTGLNWQLYNGPGFTAGVDVPRDAWFHLRLVVTGAQARLYVNDLTKPALVMDDLKSGVQKGRVALYVLTGDTYVADVRVQPTPDAPWERHLPPMPPGTLTHWSISPSYDARSRDLERPLTAAERDTIPWQDVEAEPPGIVPLYRYRDAPHLMVSFERDFSKRLEPQPGMQVVYARARIDSERDQVERLSIGYSDDVSVFLDGRILWRGRSAQYFRDPGFLGIVSPDDDTVYLPLHKGANDLELAVSELGGGWGFVCRLAPMEPGLARAVEPASPPGTR